MRKNETHVTKISSDSGNKLCERGLTAPWRFDGEVGQRGGATLRPNVGS